MEVFQKLFDKPEVIIAFGALLTSISSIVLTIKALKVQKQHHLKSVKPIGYITVGDYEDDIYISIVNNGVGPLIIRELRVSILSFCQFQQRDESLGTLGVRLDVFDFKGGPGFLRIEVAQRPPEQLRWIRGHHLLTPLLKIDFLKFLQRRGAANDRAELCVSEKVMVNPLTANKPNLAGGIVRFRIQQVRVVTPREVFKWQPLARDQLIQVPKSPGVLSRRLGLDILGELVDIHRAKDVRECREICPVVFQREFKVVAKPFAWPILRGIRFSQDVPNRVNAMCPANFGDRGLMPVGNDMQPQPSNKGCVTGWS